MDNQTTYELSWDLITEVTPQTEDEFIAGSVGDAYVECIRNFGKVDIGYIARLSGEKKENVVKTLKGVIVLNPEKFRGNMFEGYEPIDEYLSGNLFAKRMYAESASILYNGLFDEQVKLIDSVMRCNVYFDDVDLQPGMSFISTYVIDCFIEHLFGKYLPAGYHNSGSKIFSVKHDDLTGEWQIPHKNRYRGSIRNIATYGTRHKNGMAILEDILNNRDSVVYESTSSYSNGEAKRINKAATAMVQEKREMIIEEFNTWVKKTPDIREIVEEAYLEKYGYIRKRVFNGSFIKKQWGDYELYDYQLDSVARIIFTRNCLLALSVGFGKTIIMIVAALELMRMNISKKIVFSVPNNIFSQFKDAFSAAAPDADVTFIDTASFKKEKRNKVLRSIADAPKGIFVFPYSCFDMIPLSEDYYRCEINAELNEVKKAWDSNKGCVSSLKRKEKELKKKLRDLDEADKASDENVYFDELGFNMLFVDEIHNYKNISINTSSHARGINKKGSAKCNRMLDKVRYIQKNNFGAGVVFATGTPISNSMTDIYVMQKYLQNGELSLLGLSTFDAWANEFCLKTNEFEVDVDTSQYRWVTRYSKFINMPELTSIFSSVAEFSSDKRSDEIPDFEGYRDIKVPKTVAFNDYLKNISERCEAVRKKNVDPDKDNMLKITMDGRLAALDLRLVDPDAIFTPNSKVAYCAENVYRIYKETGNQKSTQLVFCDSSTPKQGFNIYDEMKKLLVHKGVPSCEIAFVHDAINDTQRKKLFDKVTTGEIRVLIGSTYKLGTGVNVQNKLIAIHHLDIPWKPSDMMQREGRILRQGNENEKVSIYRYITDGSFDAYSYQLLENKQKIITQILNGSITERRVSDVDEAVLSYGEIKALAIGNPLIKERVKTSNELSRYRVLRNKAEESVIALRKDYKEIIEMLKRQSELIERSFADQKFVKENPMSPEINFRRRVQQKVINAMKDKTIYPEETCLEENYCGFKVIRPRRIDNDKPYFIIERNNRYKVIMGKADRGVMVRIDNVIEKIPTIHTNYVMLRESLSQKLVDIEREIMSTNYYTNEIEELILTLNEIDEKLGVA